MTAIKISFPPPVFNYCSKKKALKARAVSPEESFAQDLYSILLCCFEMKLNEISASRETRFNNYDLKSTKKEEKNFQFLSIFWSSSSDRFGVREIFVQLGLMKKEEKFVLKVLIVSFLNLAPQTTQIHWLSSTACDFVFIVF